MWRDGSHNVRKMVLTIQFSAQLGGTVGVLMRKEEKLLDLEGEAGQTVKFKVKQERMQESIASACLNASIFGICVLLLKFALNIFFL